MTKTSRIVIPKLEQFLAQLSYFPRALGMVWTPAPGWTLAWAILLVILGLVPAITVYLTRLVVDSLVAAIATGATGESLRSFLIPAALMAGMLMFSKILNSSLNWIDGAHSEIVTDYISAIIHQKSAAADLACYDLPEFHDRLQQVREDASSCPLALMTSIGGLIQDMIALLALATVLIPYGIWLPLVLLVSTLPAFAVVLYFNRRYYRWRQETTPDRRWTYYYDTMLTYDRVAAEVRLFNLAPYFQSSYQTLRRRLRTEKLQLIKDETLARLGTNAAALLALGCSMAWMVWQALQGFLTLGDLALFYQAFNKGEGLMRSLLGNLGEIYSNSLFLSNLFEFLDLEPQVIDSPKPLPVPSPLTQGLCFRQVSFRYPGTEKTALKDFNLTIPAGKIVAIVGDNGAGKSTLLKLLCRFYDPEVGSIELDGIDLRNLSVEELRRQITVLFQFPVRYQATAAQNIALGDLASAPTRIEIEAFAQLAGANEVITRLPQGYETLLGKSFLDGAELSGGEWQRLALARAFLRQTPIVILDEPTSAMDPWAEAKWLDSFSSMAKGKTVIIITHRFSTALRADQIYLMRNGQIVESGNHDQLLAQDGLYAQSWKLQIQTSPKQGCHDYSDVS